MRLLDFGIAKLIAEGHADDSAAHAGRGKRVHAGIRFAGADPRRRVTTASDIYALGVVLYELLCGRRPYQLKRDSRGALEDAILGADPVRPSQVPIPDPVARARSSSVKRLRRELEGDLDTVLLKALKKKPEARYVSADALVPTCSDTCAGNRSWRGPTPGAYHLRKFIVRNKWAVSGATVTALALVAGTAVSLWQASVARDHTAAAQREATKAKVVQDFLLDIFSMNSVEQRDPEKARQTTARELLDLGSKRVDEALKDAPDARNEVLGTLANMYWQLGLPDEAAKQQRQRIEIARRLHGSDDPRVAEAILAYADAIIESPARGSAITVLDEAKRVLDVTGDVTSERRGRLLMLYARAHSYTSFRDTMHAADEAVGSSASIIRTRGACRVRCRSRRARGCRSANTSRAKRSTARRLPRSGGSSRGFGVRHRSAGGNRQRALRARRRGGGRASLPPGARRIARAERSLPQRDAAIAGPARTLPPSHLAPRRGAPADGGCNRQAVAAIRPARRRAT